jgi:hypothetical protein
MPKNSLWEAYIGSLENYFALLGADEDNQMKRTQILMHTMGVVTYQRLWDCLSSEIPADKDYVSIVANVDMVLNLRPSLIDAERKKTTRG